MANSETVSIDLRMDVGTAEITAVETISMLEDIQQVANDVGKAVKNAVAVAVDWISTKLQEGMAFVRNTFAGIS